MTKAGDIRRAAPPAFEKLPPTSSKQIGLLTLSETKKINSSIIMRK
jgi:hypothetical protein